MVLFLPAAASVPTNLTAVQDGSTLYSSLSIRVSWSPPSPMADTTGYRIGYSGGSSGSVDVSDGTANNYLLTGLQNGDSYTISIMGTSQHLSSDILIAFGEQFFIEKLRQTFSTTFLHSDYIVHISSQLSMWTPQQPPPSPSPGVFPVAQWWTAMW